MGLLCRLFRSHIGELMLWTHIVPTILAIRVGLLSGSGVGESRSGGNMPKTPFDYFKEMEFSSAGKYLIADFEPYQWRAYKLFITCFVNCGPSDLREGPRPSDACDEHW